MGIRQDSPLGGSAASGLWPVLCGPWSPSSSSSVTRQASWATLRLNSFVMRVHLGTCVCLQGGRQGHKLVLVLLVCATLWSCTSSPKQCLYEGKVCS